MKHKDSKGYLNISNNYLDILNNYALLCNRLLHLLSIAQETPCGNV